jgi:hypothetical protein
LAACVGVADTARKDNRSLAVTLPAEEQPAPSVLHRKNMLLLCDRLLYEIRQSQVEEKYVRYKEKV